MEAELLRIAAIGIIAAALAVIISEKKPELGLLLGLAFGTITLVVAFSKAGAIIEVLEDTASKAGIDGNLLVPVLKVTGMAYITQFSVDACRDVGQNSIAGKVETVGKIMMLVVAVPIATSLIRIVTSII